MYLKQFFEKMALMKFGFFCGFLQFLGDPKILETWIFLRCLGILKDGLIRKFHALNDIDVENVTTGDTYE
jgi:hypothetical protein